MSDFKAASHAVLGRGLAIERYDEYVYRKNNQSLPRIGSVVIIRRHLNEGSQYFFSTDHCQDTPKDEGWVPTTFHLPMHVVRRPSLPSGIIRTAEELVRVFESDSTEIPNPDPRYQPVENLRKYLR